MAAAIAVSHFICLSTLLRILIYNALDKALNCLASKEAEVYMEISAMLVQVALNPERS